MNRLTERDFKFTSAYVAQRLQSFPMAQCLSKLQEYEDAEEEGLLVRLPCKVGDTVYEANKRGFISTYKIISVHFSNCSTLIGWTLIDGIYSNLNGFELLALGKTVFLTKEDAEKALAESEGNND